MPVTIEIAVGAVMSRFTCDGDVVTLFQLFLNHPLADKALYDAALARLHGQLDPTTAESRAEAGGPVPPAVAPAASLPSSPQVSPGSPKVSESSPDGDRPARASIPPGPRPTTRQGLRDYDDAIVLTCTWEHQKRMGQARVRVVDLSDLTKQYGVVPFSVRAACDRLAATGEMVRLNQRSVRLATPFELASRTQRVTVLAPRGASAPAPAVVLPPVASVDDPAPIPPGSSDTRPFSPPAVSVSVGPPVRTIQERRADIRRVVRDVLNEEARCGLKALQRTAKDEVPDATDADVEWVLNSLRNENQIGVMTIGTERWYSRRPTVSSIV